jgi:hypothetical protein
MAPNEEEDIVVNEEEEEEEDEGERFHVTCIGMVSMDG